MPESTLISEGLSLMALGMGFVFVFLSVLVVTTTLMSKVIGRFFPEPPAPPDPTRRTAASAADEDELKVVISAALHRFRKRH
ncbi:sodium pump decarboxylase subunit gamma [Halomonas aestuarii]|uniref:Probable oxaloacetate decarboxylase gamma chain n=1 Tax=Halomonas aestuarii TaxID=1897729 RepID=A0A1J0VIL7_9GAMM|nr:OadG family transporter subunit [Halomonas aestuarii]APE31884.1 sodium pump decarboxylase subunit gamma [Halomonas aestuarii]